MKAHSSRRWTNNSMVGKSRVEFIPLPSSPSRVRRGYAYGSLCRCRPIWLRGELRTKEQSALARAGEGILEAFFSDMRLCTHGFEREYCDNELSGILAPPVGKARCERRSGPCHLPRKRQSGFVCLQGIGYAAATSRSSLKHKTFYSHLTSPMELHALQRLGNGSCMKSYPLEDRRA